MSTAAIIMMTIAMLMVWGGLALAVRNIRRSPEHPDEVEPAHEEQVQAPGGDAAAQRPAPAERI